MNETLVIARADIPIGANPKSARLTEYPGFDWLRLVLASIVALYHEGLPLPEGFDGDIAVQVFFALSGWLIGGILLKSTLHDMPRFFFNRATRIWIPYAGAVAALYGFAVLYQGVNAGWLKYLFHDATFTHQLFVHYPREMHEMPFDGAGRLFWSISVEEQFYLIAPAVILCPFGRNLAAWATIAAALIFGAVLGAPIALGVIAAILQRQHPNWYLKPAAYAALAAATVLIATGISLGHAPDYLRPIFAICIVLLFAVPGRRSAVGVFAGGISYPMYLNHWIGAFVGHAITRHLLRIAEPNDSRIVFIATAYAASLAIGCIAYWLVDRPVLGNRERWYNPRVGLICGAAAYLLVTLGVIGGLLIG